MAQVSFGRTVGRTAVLVAAGGLGAALYEGVKAIFTPKKEVKGSKKGGKKGGKKGSKKRKKAAPETKVKAKVKAKVKGKGRKAA